MEDLLPLAVFTMCYVAGPGLFIFSPFLLWWFGRPWLAVLGVSAYVWFSYLRRPNRERRTDSMWPAFRNVFFLKPLVKYFDQKILYDGPKLDPNKTYIFALHPHGNLAYNRAMLGFFREQLFNKAFGPIDTRTLAATVTFHVPVIRDAFIWSGCVEASQRMANKVLDDGLSVMVYPGGEMEQLLTHNEHERVYIKKHKGFLKLALRRGCDVIPIYIFGTNRLWYTYDWFFDLRAWIVHKFRVALPIFHGRSFVPMPRRTKLTAVAGVPLRVEQDENPTSEKLDALHERYIRELTQLYNDHIELADGKPLEIY